ncbi:MAG: helix-turn-helix transcriptional regulator [Clostridia bacterium]|nr:helix-turn-helix transcriptional regulator [Clostridia bacterium]
MYIDYSKLWKLLIDKNMTKTDLLELTGISSRVLAKLSKNQIVTTDTVAKICTALGCNVGDIMEAVSEEKLTLYQRYKQFGKVVSENDIYKTVTFTVNEQKYTVYVTKKTATKFTHIHCRENKTVCWEQLYILGGISTPGRDLSVILTRPEKEKNEQVIVLIKGKPAVITGLDDNGFVSAHGVAKNDSDVYVMSEAAFKLFGKK